MTAPLSDEKREAVQLEICERLAGGESLKKICRSKHIPNRTTIFRWLRDDDSFAKIYSIARTDLAHLLFEEAIELADESKRQVMSAGVDPKIVNALVRTYELRVDTRKWSAAKLLPKTYSDRVALAGDPDAPLVAPSDPMEMAKQVAFLLRRGEEAEKDAKEKEAAPQDLESIATQPLPQRPEPTPEAKPIVERVEPEDVKVETPIQRPHLRTPVYQSSYRAPVRRPMWGVRLHPQQEGGGWPEFDQGDQQQRHLPENERHTDDSGGHDQFLTTAHRAAVEDQQ